MSKRAYQRIFTLATGGMGEVEVALRGRSGVEQLHALKRPYPHLHADPAFAAMFRDEARLAALIRHPNVVSVVDFGQDEEGPFLAMDYVDGLTVAEILAGSGPEPLPLAMCVGIAAQAARGLHAAHELKDNQGHPLNLVHRDVSPKNILVGFDGVARVTDFGIAKALGNLNRTTTGIIKGNIGYVAPEALRFQTLDRRSDLFSLGVVLVEMLTGERLYAGADSPEIARRILDEPPPDILDARPGAPAALVELIFEMLAKDPADRPTGAAEVASRLDAILHEISIANGAFDLAATMTRTFAAQRGQRADAIAQGIKRVLENTSPAGAPRHRRNARWGVIGAAVLLTAAAIGYRAFSEAHGLRGEYFGDIDLRSAKLSRIDREIAFDWSAAPPGPGMAPENFSVRWQGRISAPAPGWRSLCVISDDGTRLWFDGKLIIDQWGRQWPTQKCAQVNFEAYKKHPIKIEYLQLAGLAYVRLFWSTAVTGTSGDYAPVPAAFLYPR